MTTVVIVAVIYRVEVEVVEKVGLMMVDTCDRGPPKDREDGAELPLEYGTEPVPDGLFEPFWLGDTLRPVPEAVEGDTPPVGKLVEDFWCELGPPEGCLEGLESEMLPDGFTDPDGRTDPLGPTEPFGLTEPDGPTEPLGLIELEGRTEPEGLTDPDGPTDPLGLTDPDGLTDPLGLTDPDGLTDPLGLTDPDGPTDPVGRTLLREPVPVPESDELWQRDAGNVVVVASEMTVVVVVVVEGSTGLPPPAPATVLKVFNENR